MYVVTESPYDADNTGATDARAAIQAAIDKADDPTWPDPPDPSMPPGGVVYFPAGIYRIDLASGLGLVLKSRIQYVGEGRGNTILRLGNSQAGALLDVVNDGFDIVLRDMTLDLADLSVSGTAALRVELARRILVQNVEFTTGTPTTNSDTHGVGALIGNGADSGDATNISIQSCYFTQLGSAAVQARAGAQHVRIASCFFTRKTSPTGSAFYSALIVQDSSSSTSSTPRIRDLAFVLNEVDDALDLSLTGRIASSTAFYPITLVTLAENRLVGRVALEAVSNATIRTNTLRPAEGVPLTVKRSRRVRITGNDVEASTGHALHIDGKAPGGVAYDFPVEDLQILGNTITQHHASSDGILIENVERGIVATNIITCVDVTIPANAGIHHYTGPFISGAAQSTRRSLIVAQNIVTAFLNALLLERHKDALQQGVVLAGLIVQGNPGVAGNGIKFTSTQVSRLALHGLVTGTDIANSVVSPPASLAAGTLGRDSGDTTGVGMYVCTSPAQASYIQNAPKGSLYVDRDSTTPGTVLHVRESSGWVPK